MEFESRDFLIEKIVDEVETEIHWRLLNLKSQKEARGVLEIEQKKYIFHAPFCFCQICPKTDQEFMQKVNSS